MKTEDIFLKRVFLKPLYLFLKAIQDPLFPFCNANFFPSRSHTSRLSRQLSVSFSMPVSITVCILLNVPECFLKLFIRTRKVPSDITRGCLDNDETFDCDLSPWVLGPC